MLKTYTPAETRDWTAADLDALIGAYVDIRVPAVDADIDAAGGISDFEGGAGICFHAGIAAYPEVPRTAFADFTNGGGWSWPAAEGAWVSVCREHGDHTDTAGIDCLTRHGAGAARTDVAA